MPGQTKVLARTYPWIEDQMHRKLKGTTLESQNETVLRGLQRLGFSR